MSDYRVYSQQSVTVLHLSGDDHAEFLQNQGTADLRGPAGLCRYSLWLDHKGRIQADAYVLKIDETAMLLISYAVPAEELLSRFGRFIIADDVTVENRSSRYQLFSIWRPQDNAGPEGLPTPEPGSFVSHPGGYAWSGRRLGPGTLDLLLPAGSDAPEVAHAIGHAEAERLRLQAGMPLIPQDSADDLTPVEAGVLSAVSFDKGCYLGQEVVARTHRLQRGTRRLVRMGNLPAGIKCPRALSVDGTVAGCLTSSASDSSGAVIGMGWLKSRFPAGHFSFDGLSCEVEDLDPS